MIKLFAIVLLFHISQLVYGQVDSNRIFLASKGTWKYPASKCIIQKRGHGPVADLSTAVVFICDSSYPVKAVFEGEVILVNEYDSVHLVVTRYGSYFIGYSNLEVPQVKKGDTIKVGQIIGRMAKNLDEVYSVEMMLSAKDDDDIELEPWFKKKDLSVSP
jgi:Peptidase family M23